MTSDEQRIFVAEKLLGIKPPEPHQIGEGYSFQDWVDDLPPLTLDWLHECERKLRPEVANKYADELTKITSFGANPHWTHCFHLLNATAEERLTALVKVLGGSI